MTYVALLRGINVGGNRKVDMKQLTRTFERVGMSDVRTVHQLRQCGLSK